MSRKQTPKTRPIQTVGFISLGCPKNLVDSEKMLGLLAESGLAITNDPSDADAIVINTCGFLQASKDESHGGDPRRRQVQKDRPLPAHHRGRLPRPALPDQASGRGSGDRFTRRRLQPRHQSSKPSAAARLREHQQPHYLGKYHQLKQLEKVVTLEADQGRLRLTPRHYAYLRVSEGCNQGCSFCTIPSIRGPMRSKPVDRILAEARELAADGCQELILIGQDTTSYGEDIDYAGGLAGLLRTLDSGADRRALAATDVRLSLVLHR